MAASPPVSVPYQATVVSQDGRVTHTWEAFFRAMLNGVTGPAGTPGTNGINGTNGTNGINGSNGSTWYSAATTPVALTGVNGDYWLNTATGDVYKMVAGLWGTPIENLVVSGNFDGGQAGSNFGGLGTVNGGGA